MKMTVEDLIKELSDFPKDMEVVLFREGCEDYEGFYDNFIRPEINDDGQLVID